MSPTLHELYTIVKKKLKLKSFENFLRKTQSIDQKYIIMI